MSPHNSNNYPVLPEFAANARVNSERYEQLYRESVTDPAGFWAKQAEQYLDFSTPYDSVVQYDAQCGQARWFDGGTLNVSEHCLDRHLATRAHQTAMFWESDNGEGSYSLSYQQLHEQVCRFANGLKSLGVKTGDRVCIYLPMIPETAVALLACARIGAIHTAVFAGFSPEALRDRIEDAGAKVVITSDYSVRGGKQIPLKENVDGAVALTNGVDHVVTVRRTGGEVAWDDSRDIWFHDLISKQSSECEAVQLPAEAPLFILYTSGSTGKPKGVVHTQAGYLLMGMTGLHNIFDYRDQQVLWCTADIGWITGHTYCLYTPLASGASMVWFEGVPTYPDAGRVWEIVDKYQVNIFYTAPTLVRALSSQGDEPVRKASRASLHIMATCGEPINPDAWEWLFNVVGERRCPVLDTWWQTETAAPLLTPLPGAHAIKPGAAAKPFFGVQPAILDPQTGKEMDGECEGVLVMKYTWPSQARTVWGSDSRYFDNYYSQYAGYYFTGDGARRDEDGYYWITGRVDDVLNVSGHRIGTAELEAALNEHPDVLEAAVVGFPHDIKGQGIYSYVTLKSGVAGSDELKQALIQLCVKEIGPIAKPDYIQWATALPKTRSGKIMRRILRKIAENDLGSLGDTSTLADPAVVDTLINERLIS